MLLFTDARLTKVSFIFLQNLFKIFLFCLEPWRSLSPGSTGRLKTLVRTSALSAAVPLSFSLLLCLSRDLVSQGDAVLGAKAPALSWARLGKKKKFLAAESSPGSKHRRLTHTHTQTHWGQSLCWFQGFIFSYFINEFFCVSLLTVREPAPFPIIPACRDLWPSTPSLFWPTVFVGQKCSESDFML